MKKTAFARISMIFCLAGAALAAASASRAAEAPVTNAAVYQCYQGTPGGANRNSVVATVDKSNQVTSVAATREEADLPVYAKLMVKAGGDFNSLFNPVKQVNAGYEVRKDAAKRAQLKIGEVTLNCLQTNEE